jgi:hypothetical protein
MLRRIDHSIIARPGIQDAPATPIAILMMQHGTPQSLPQAAEGEDGIMQLAAAQPLSTCVATLS